MSSSVPPPSRLAPVPPSKPVYPHIHDLVARAEGLRPGDRASIELWMKFATERWGQANAHLSSGTLDAAYVDYLLAFTVLVKIIPVFPDFSTFAVGRLHHDFEALQRELKKKNPEFTKVKDEIKRNNEISGVVSAQAQLEAEAQLDSGRARASPSGMNGRPSRISESSSKKKPEVRAKPVFLSIQPPPDSQISAPNNPNASRDLGLKNGRTVPTDLELKARFERLATNPSKSGSSTPPLSQHSIRYSASSILHGPREMPAKPPSLDVNLLPKLPAPTYSPSTSFGSPTGIPPQRSLARSQLPQQGPTASLAKTSELWPTLAKETTVSADMLSTYLSESPASVLLLDVRSREEFDQGHIFARCVVCIEPIVLRDGMSGDDLDATFVLAPTREQEFFAERHKRNLVVYYDQSTSDNKFLSGSTNDEHLIALRSLHMAIYDYSYQKQLQNPPRLLVGGLDAWVNLVGKQALKVTDLNEIAPSRPLGMASREARSIERPGRGVGTGGGTSPHRRLARSLVQGRQDRSAQRGSLPPPLKRQSYPKNHGAASVDPINIEEEQRWMERLQKEKEPLVTIVPGSAVDESEIKKRRRAISVVTSNDPSHVRTVEEFFQRYPATPHIQQSMVAPPLPTPQSVNSSSPSLNRRNTIIDHPFYGFTDVRNPEFHPPPAPVRPPPVVPRKSYSGVSERLAPALPPSLPLAPERPPKIPIVTGKSRAPTFAGMGSVNIGSTGLKNLGNTCYMNSILQCMSGTIPLSRYFLDGSYKGHVNKENPLGSRGVLAEAFASIVRSLWSGDYNFISPVTMKDVSGRLNDMFRNNDQQDAQEFLEFLLDGLHEDLNPYASRGKLRPLSEDEERRREKMPAQQASNIEWQRYTHQNYSVVVNWFQGQLSSRLKCLTCGITSTTYSPFMYLSLPIPSSKRGNFTLRDCLEEFVKEETLEKDDAWHCPNCKKPRKATKKLTVTRLPHILIIHLKRFTNRGPWRDKLNTFIDIPLKALDLTKYVPPLLVKEDMPKGMAPPTAEVTPPFFYDLYAVCNHYGTLNGGHYTAFVRNSYKGGWNSFDDSKATFVDESRVVSRNAYVLFWVRSNIM